MEKKLPIHLQRLKEVRTARGMTAQHMADELHVSESTYSRIANGETALTFEMATQAADILDISLDYLAGRDAPKPDDPVHPDSYYVAYRDGHKFINARRNEIRILAITVALLVIAIFYILVDALHGGWGMIRYDAVVRHASDAARMFFGLL